MKLRKAHGAVTELYPGNSLPLAPTGTAVMPTQACDFTNRGASGNCLDIGDSTEKPEVHALRVPVIPQEVKPPSNGTRLVGMKRLAIH